MVLISNSRKRSVDFDSERMPLKKDLSTHSMKLTFFFLFKIGAAAAVKQNIT